MNRLIFIDGLRGILALIVFLHHFVLMFMPAYYFGGATRQIAFSNTSDTFKTIAYTPLNLFINGNFAVIFFFVLSGYILSTKHLIKESPINLAQDIFKRYFRLIIPILFSCLLIYFFHRIGLFKSNYNLNNQMNADWLNGLFKLDYSFFNTLKYSITEAIFERNTSYNAVLWTMSFEFYGSIIVFISLFVTSKSNRPNAIILFFTILVSFTGALRLIPFCLGLLIANLEYRSAFFNFKSINNKLILFLVFIAGLYFSSYPAVPDGIIKKHMHSLIYIKNFQCLPLYEAIGSALLLIVIIKSKLLKQILSFKLFSFLGKISFGIYLTHLTLIGSISVITFSLLYNNNNYYSSVAITFGISLIATVLVGYVFYFLIDKNTPKWSNKISNYFFGVNKKSS